MEEILKLKCPNLSSGRHTAIDLELFESLAEAILKYWKLQDFDETLIEISNQVESTQLQDYVY